jgi:hypothetical protein
MKKLILIICFLVSQQVFPQMPLERDYSDNCYSFGLNYHYCLIYQNPSFWINRENYYCINKDYEPALNKGFKLGVCGTIPAGESTRIFVGINYKNSGVVLKNHLNVPYHNQGSISYVNFVNEIAGKFIAIDLQTLLGYRVMEKLYFSLGFSTVYQVDLGIIEYYYPENSSTKVLNYIYQFRNSKFLYFSPIINLSYDFALTSKKFGLILSPNIQYEFGLYDFLNDMKWTNNTLAFGLSVRFTDYIKKFTEY